MYSLAPGAARVFSNVSKMWEEVQVLASAISTLRAAQVFVASKAGKEAARSFSKHAPNVGCTRVSKGAAAGFFLRAPARCFSGCSLEGGREGGSRSIVAGGPCDGCEVSSRQMRFWRKGGTVGEHDAWRVLLRPLPKFDNFWLVHVAF